MYLCIDTTTSEAGITLVDNHSPEGAIGQSRLLGYSKLNPLNASETILIIIDELIKKADIELTDLKGIFVIKGPGSFTGLRVGIAVANQFAHQLKIPIIGLKTDEWGRYRTDESDFVYLQSMNKVEVYISKIENRKPYLPAGKSKIEIKPQIIPIEELSGKKMWLGELSEDHLSKLPSTFTQITDVLSPEETWARVVKKAFNVNHTTYNLIEPYYGKEPMITKSKKKLSI